MSESKIEKEMRLHWQKLNKENEEKMRKKKPKLNTNLPQI